jgi:hypothetical protein
LSVGPTGPTLKVFFVQNLKNDTDPSISRSANTGQCSVEDKAILIWIRILLFTLIRIRILLLNLILIQIWLFSPDPAVWSGSGSSLFQRGNVPYTVFFIHLNTAGHNRQWIHTNGIDRYYWSILSVMLTNGSINPLVKDFSFWSIVWQICHKIIVKPMTIDPLVKT